jgi:HEAT repeat protein
MSSKMMCFIIIAALGGNISTLLALDSTTKDEQNAWLKMLQDERAELRVQGIEALSKTPNDETTFLAIVNCLDDSVEAVRTKAASTLVKMAHLADERSVRLLITYIQSENVQTSHFAISVLKAVGKKALDAIPSLIQVADKRGFIDAIEAISTIGPTSPPVIKEIARLLESKDDYIQEAAAKCLESFGPGAECVSRELTRALRGHNWRVRLSVMRTLSAIGAHDKEVVDGLVDILREDSCISIEAVTLLSKIGSQSSAALIDLLSHDNPAVRANAVFCLGKIGEKSAVGNLCKLSKDKNSAVRIAVMSALGRIGEKTDDVIRVLKEAQGDSDSNVKNRADEVLRKFGFWRP